MTRLTYGLGLTAALLVTAASAHASPSYNASLASPNATSPTQGLSSSSSGTNSSWFNGDGNPQGGWVVDGDGGSIELGLRAKQRSQLPIYWTSDDHYTVPVGTSGGRAIWNYEFSIDVNMGGQGPNTLSNMLAAGDLFSLTVSDTHGHSATVDPLSNWHDDSGYGHALGSNDPTSPPATMTTAGRGVLDTTSNDWAAQNSENMTFGDSPLAAFFNPNAEDTYTFVLAITDSAHQVIASDTMIVDAVPEPATLSLLGGAVLGMVGLRRRRATAT